MRRVGIDLINQWLRVTLRGQVTFIFTEKLQISILDLIDDWAGLVQQQLTMK